jgi:hypothetical protein
MDDRQKKKIVSATRVVASTLGVLVGLAGIDHGFFEILQGNSEPGGVIIEAIGPAQRFWEYGTETALTIIPNFLFTGILAIIFGILIVIWSIAFIQTKYGAGILMLLSTVLFLVGGGIAPIFMAVIASLTASQINKSLSWLRKILPVRVWQFLARIWLVSLITFVILFFITVEIAIFGWPLTLFFDAQTAFTHLNTLSYIMLGVMVLCVLSGLAHDYHVQRDI